MNITIIAYGTRGDVQPALALGKALQTAGHRARVVASANFAPWIASHGLEVAASRVDVMGVMRGEGGQQWIEHGNRTLRQLRVMKRLLDQHGMTMMRDAWAACQDADAVISSITSDAFALSIAERLGTAHISAPLQPALVPTRVGTAAIGAPLPNRVSIINYLVGKWLFEPAAWRVMAGPTNRFRQEVLGLPPQTGREHRRAYRRSLIVQGFSRHVVPHPYDWPPHMHTAGYWFLDESRGWEPPPALAEFLAAGTPPIYIGFGSMTGPDPAGLTRLIVEAVTASGERAILQSGWAGIGEAGLPPEIYPLGVAPHDWLFPRMRAVLHHGGAGTTAESLRAGVPTVVVPHMADQPFWGRRVAALGVGPRPIRRDRLTAATLAAAIRMAVADARMRGRAAELGARIRAEDGVRTAVRVIDRIIAESAL